jgi:ferredoxin-NADP reductase
MRQTTVPSDTIARVRAIERVSPWASIVRLDLGGRGFPFSAGQAVAVGLLTQEIRKPYSIACSPGQARATGCVELLIGAVAPGRLGAHLTPLRPGSVVGVRGPFGRFGLPPRLAARSLLFVAGGTGIAPLRSMLSEALDRAAPPAIDLVYSARTPADLAFDAEFRRLHRAGRIRYWPTVTRGAGRHWKGRQRRIDTTLLSSALRPRPTCFVCGPASFVTGVPGMLRALGVRAGSVRREEY